MLCRRTTTTSSSTSLLSRSFLSCSQLVSSKSFNSGNTSSSSSSSREWGNWEDSSSKSNNNNKTKSSSDKSNANDYSDESENMARVNYYDSKAFIGARRAGATIICRQKPVIRSYTELAIDYLRPKKESPNSYIDSQQLAKIFGYLIIPVATIIFWKGHYEEFPDYWERQAAQIQSKPLNDAEGQKKKYSYFDVIDSLENRREKAMVGKGYGSAATTPASIEVKS